MLGAIAGAVGGEPDGEVTRFVEDLAQDMVGAAGGGLDLRLHDGTFELRPLVEGDPLNVGMTGTAAGRLRLGSERGSWCDDLLFVEADVDVGQDVLRLHLEGIRGQFPDAHMMGPGSGTASADLL